MSSSGSCSRYESPTGARSQCEEVPSLLQRLRLNYFLISPELIFLLGKFSLSLCLELSFSASLATPFQPANIFLHSEAGEMKAFWSFSGVSQSSNGASLPGLTQPSPQLHIWKSLSCISYFPGSQKGRLKWEENLSFKTQKWAKCLHFSWAALFSVKT